MCGIAGIWNYAGEVPAEARVQAMSEAMQHRGPDGTGLQPFVGGAVGMVRLALLDLSARGDQPMWSACGRVAIVFNGEIYNFREERRALESRGHVFRSSTDTEVILAAYLEYGLRFVDHLRGMYALALLDWRETGGDRTPVVVLARGPLGVKPLYVAEIGNTEPTLVFASELRAVLASGLVERRVSPDGLNDYLRLGCTLQPRTIIDGVRMVAPGSIEIYGPGRKVERRRFWTFPAYQPRNESFAAAAERLRGELEESVRLHALADAPLGAFLSGGIDSTAVTALMRKHVSRLHTYTFRFPELPGDDESQEATETARRLDCEHHVVELTGRQVRELLPTFANQIDQPSVDGLNSWFISRAAASDVKGVLSGLGGDEWFAGYSVAGRMLRAATTFGGRLRAAAAHAAHQGLKIPLPYSLQRRLESAAAYRSQLALWMRSHVVFTSEDADALLASPRSTSCRQLDADLRQTLQAGVGRDWAAETPVGTACLLDHYVFMMCQLLRDADATGMASSLELRVPLVDLRIAEFSRSCRDDYKLTVESSRRGQTKMVFREAVRDLIPNSAARVPKRGFNVPNEWWMRRDLAPLVEDTCEPAAVVQRGWFDPNAVRALFENRRSPHAEIVYPRLWAVMLLELWARTVFDQTPRPCFEPFVAARNITSPVSASSVE
jgi:asparagine synthase (glutamine-hydrolysing)